MRKLVLLILVIALLVPLVYSAPLDLFQQIPYGFPTDASVFDSQDITYNNITNSLFITIHDRGVTTRGFIREYTPQGVFTGFNINLEEDVGVSPVAPTRGIATNGTHLFVGEVADTRNDIMIFLLNGTHIRNFTTDSIGNTDGGLTFNRTIVSGTLQDVLYFLQLNNSETALFQNIEKPSGSSVFFPNMSLYCSDDTDRPQGITKIESTGSFFVSCNSSKIIGEYDADGQTTGFNFSIAETTTSRGLANNESHLFVGDRRLNEAGKRINIYEISTGNFITSFDAFSGVAQARSITRVGDEFFVIDRVNDKIQRYNSTFGIIQGQNFSTLSEGTDPRALVSNGTHLFMIEDDSRLVIIYDLNGNLVSNFSTVPTRLPRGIGINGSNIFILDGAGTQDGASFHQINLYDLQGNYLNENISLEIPLQFNEDFATGLKITDRAIYSTSERDDFLCPVIQDCQTVRAWLPNGTLTPFVINLTSGGESFATDIEFLPEIDQYLISGAFGINFIAHRFFLFYEGLGVPTTTSNECEVSGTFGLCNETSVGDIVTRVAYNCSQGLASVFSVDRSGTSLFNSSMEREGLTDLFLFDNADITIETENTYDFESLCFNEVNSFGSSSSLNFVTTPVVAEAEELPLSDAVQIVAMLALFLLIIGILLFEGRERR